MNGRLPVCGGCGALRRTSGALVRRCQGCGAPPRLAWIEVAGLRVDPGRLVKEGHPAATAVLQRILARVLVLQT